MSNLHLLLSLYPSLCLYPHLAFSLALPLFSFSNNPPPPSPSAMQYGTSGTQQSSSVMSVVKTDQVSPPPGGGGLNQARAPLQADLREMISMYVPSASAEGGDTQRNYSANLQQHYLTSTASLTHI